MIDMTFWKVFWSFQICSWSFARWSQKYDFYFWYSVATWRICQKVGLNFPQQGIMLLVSVGMILFQTFKVLASIVLKKNRSLWVVITWYHLNSYSLEQSERANLVLNLKMFTRTERTVRCSTVWLMLWPKFDLHLQVRIHRYPRSTTKRVVGGSLL